MLGLQSNSHIMFGCFSMLDRMGTVTVWSQLSKSSIPLPADLRRAVAVSTALGK
jgi:hypothetical protein